MNIVVGSGPNGLAAAIVLAQAGLKVTVHEAAPVAGGATRSGELTLPGFIHDLGSAVHPMALTSPFFSKLPLTQHGLDWIWPDAGSGGSVSGFGGGGSRARCGLWRL